ncbi:MAG: hypothetical protein ACI9M9_001504 [Flavobacteriaceae bacterium]|jgi:hypothetical protein
MKKLLFTALILSLAFTSCKKVEDAVDCAQAADDSIAAAIAFAAAPTDLALCATYKSALQRLIAENCGGATAVATAQTSLDAVLIACP